MVTDGSERNSGPATKTYVDAKIAIAPDGVNEVGIAHEFTVTVMEDAGTSAGFQPAADELVTVSFTSTGGADANDDQTCTTGTDGTCTVSVNSNKVGMITAHAKSTVTVDGLSFTIETDGVAPNSDDAEKRYVDATIEITPDGVNEVGDQHDFTVTVTVDPGDTTFTGTVTGYVVLPPAPYTMSDCGALTFAGNVATCNVSINSASAGVFEAGATAVVTFSDTDGNFAEVTRSTDGSLTPSGLTNSDEATKQYVDSYVTIAQDALNGITEDHTFRVTVYGNDGIAAADGGDGADGFTPYPGATIAVDALFGSTIGSITGGTCVVDTVTGVDGTCTVVVSSAEKGFIQVQATSTLTIDGVTMTRVTDGSETVTATADLGGSGVLNSGPATKTWVDASLAWFKVDQDGLKLGGATFAVTRTHDRFGVAVTEPAMVVVDNSAPDMDPDDGEFLLDRLVFGTYTVVETVAPVGYLGSDRVDTVVIVDLDGSDAIANNGPDVVISEAWINTLPWEGCTPGYWRNRVYLWDDAADPLAIAAGFHTETSFNAHFGITALESGYPDTYTMWDAINQGGGNEGKLARHGTSALLNIAADIYYRNPFPTVGELEAAIADAYVTDIFEPLSTQIADANNEDHQSCPS